MGKELGHIVHLSSVHRAHDTRVFVKECVSAAMAGYKVTLVARADREETLQGVRIVPVPSYANRLLRMTRGSLFVLRKALKVNGDVYQFHDPELLPIGLVLKLRGKRVIYDVHESTGKQILSKEWIPALLRPAASGITSMLETVVSRTFDAVVVATPPIAERFSNRKTVLVRNFAKVEEFGTIPLSDYFDRNSTAVYVGSLTTARGVRQMLAAGLLLPKAISLRIGGDSSTVMDIVGDPDRLPDNVELLGRLDRNQVREEYSRARVGLCVLQPVPNYMDALPVKMFEYMAAGLPVIASRFPYWEQFIKNHDAGIMVDPTNPEEIADAITWVMDHPQEAKAMGERGRHAAISEYSWNSESESLLTLYCQLMTEPNEAAECKHPT